MVICRHTNEQDNATYVDGMRRAGIDATQNVIATAQIGDAQLRALIPGVTLRAAGLNGLTTAEIAGRRTGGAGATVTVGATLPTIARSTVGPNRSPRPIASATSRRWSGS